MLDMDQAQRRDIRKLEDNTLSMSLDEYQEDSPLEMLLVESDYKCNNWIIDGNDFVKQNLPQTDSLIFNIAPFEELKMKNIVGLNIKGTVTVVNVTSRVPLFASVGLFGDFRVLDAPLRDSDFTIPLSLSNFSQGVVDSLVTEKGFDVILNFNGGGSNCSVTLSDLRLEVEFEDGLLSEKEVFLNRVYPVGSIYMSVNDTDPSVLFGGEWEKIEDTFLLSSGSRTVGTTGGSEDAVVVQHNHTQASHTHTPSNGRSFMTAPSDSSWGEDSASALSGSGNYYPYTQSTDHNVYMQGSGSATPTINNNGVSGTGKNMPPFLVVNIWQRIR